MASHFRRHTVIPGRCSYECGGMTSVQLLSMRKKMGDNADGPARRERLEDIDWNAPGKVKSIVQMDAWRMRATTNERKSRGTIQKPDQGKQVHEDDRTKLAYLKSTYCALRQKPLTVLVRVAFIAEGNGSLETSAVGSSIDIVDFSSIVEGLACEIYGVREVGKIAFGGGAIFDGGGGKETDTVRGRGSFEGVATARTLGVFGREDSLKIDLALLGVELVGDASKDSCDAEPEGGVKACREIRDALRKDVIVEADWGIGGNGSSTAVTREGILDNEMVGTGGIVSPLPIAPSAARDMRDALNDSVEAVTLLSERPGESFEMKLIRRARLRGVFTSFDPSLSFLPLEGVLDLRNVPEGVGVGSEGEGVSDAVVATDHLLWRSPELLVDERNCWDCAVLSSTQFFESEGVAGHTVKGAVENESSGVQVGNIVVLGDTGNAVDEGDTENAVVDGDTASAVSDGGLGNES
ncbi:uncharacterized protein HD556DRAFT_1308478 [Suillus plorans]|uniref:Uncharacterized protein n=1 Tax=Suillus plorans TaxID=116603 RepID=A0A9P7ARJ9_9AGAM|nr:uncharacterized protein HD556DRAFT_1308478 [Suillus plorans]KAG1793617.1 hypothetical protein HD556DRAFT_1308478 [Suillus plorans]